MTIFSEGVLKRSTNT